jgi:hypothetical protein
MSQNQREAFEAFCRKGDQEVGKMLDRDEVGYTNLVVAACYEAWQAAIQHARDVAVKACEGVASPQTTPYADGYNQGAIDCESAIKEALK